MEIIDDLQRDGLVIVRSDSRFAYGHDAVLLTDFVRAHAGERPLYGKIRLLHRRAKLLNVFGGVAYEKPPALLNNALCALRRFVYIQRIVKRARGAALVGAFCAAGKIRRVAHRPVEPAELRFRKRPRVA